MATEFTVGGFFARWLFALVLVFSTYNPSVYSFAAWTLDGESTFGPPMALAGVALLIGWVIFVRATLMSIGVVGIALAGALFGCLVWLLVDVGLLSYESTSTITWVVLVLLSLILATGMSWSHIRRRLTGQFDVDDMDD